MKYSVYPIVNGCSVPSVFTGTMEECRMFTSDWREKGLDWIVLEDY